MLNTSDNLCIFSSLDRYPILFADRERLLRGLGLGVLLLHLRQRALELIERQAVGFLEVDGFRVAGELVELGIELLDRIQRWLGVQLGNHGLVLFQFGHELSGLSAYRRAFEVS